MEAPNIQKLQSMFPLVEVHVIEEIANKYSGSKLYTEAIPQLKLIQEYKAAEPVPAHTHAGLTSASAAGDEGAEGSDAPPAYSTSTAPISTEPSAPSSPSDDVDDVEFGDQQTKSNHSYDQDDERPDCMTTERVNCYLVMHCSNLIAVIMLACSLIISELAYNPDDQQYDEGSVRYNRAPGYYTTAAWCGFEDYTYNSYDELCDPEYTLYYNTEGDYSTTPEYLAIGTDTWCIVQDTAYASFALTITAIAVSGFSCMYACWALSWCHYGAKFAVVSNVLPILFTLGSVMVWLNMSDDATVPCMNGPNGRMGTSILLNIAAVAFLSVNLLLALCDGRLATFGPKNDACGTKLCNAFCGQ